MLEPVKKISLADAAMKQIKDAILGKKILPGELLGKQQQLCQDLNVSRPILREALSMLRAQGYITVSKEKVFVNSIIPDQMVELIEILLKEDKEKIFELNEVRIILESNMAATAIEVATNEDIEKIKKAFQELQKSYVNQSLGYDEDVKFHLRLAESSHNTVYIHILYTFLDLFAKATYMYRSVLFRQEGNAEISMTQHQEIFNAFIEKDPERIRKAIADHLTWGGNEIRKLTSSAEINYEQTQAIKDPVRIGGENELCD